MARAKKDVAPPAAEKVDLGHYQGLPVLTTGIEMPGAAGGLREPMKTEPMLLQVGAHVFATFELDPHKFRYDPIEVDGTIIGWTLVHVLAVINATFVDENLVREQLDEMARRVAERQEGERLAKEKAKPQQRIEPAIFEKDHEQGRHSDGLVADCPLCDSEQDAADAEAMADG